MLSILITWCDRHHLALTLPHNRLVLNNIRKDAEIIIVNGGGNLFALTALLAEIGAPNLRVIDLPGETFNKARALNLGAFCCRGDIIFMIDADIIISSAMLDKSLALLDPKNFVTIRSVIEVKPQFRGPFLHEIVRRSDYVCRDGRRASIEYCVGADNSRSGPGLILVRRADFIQIGGFNSTLEGWGFEDYDFQLRLQFALGLERVTSSEVLHLSHPCATDPNKRDSNQRNQAIAELNYWKGNLSGTYLGDVEAWRSRLVQLDSRASSEFVRSHKTES